MRTTAALALAGTMILAVAGCSQGTTGSGGVPSAAAGGTGGSGPAALRTAPVDSPVGTGAGSSSGGSGSSAGATGSAK